MPWGSLILGEPAEMRIRIEHIKAEGLTLKFEEKPEFFPVLSEIINQGECQFVAPIKTALKAIQVGDMIEVEGDIQTSVRLPCGRCLKASVNHLKSRFALTYVRRLPGTQEDTENDEIELSADEMGLIQFQGEEINLRDGIQEQVVMALPFRALCREDCKGLCFQCGADLNEGDCGCNRQAPSGKFAALKNLKLEP
jgi:uncharacterized protein